LGERDARLLYLRSRLFGAPLNSIAPCPRCQTQLEFVLDTDELVGKSPPPPARLPLTLGGRDLQLRPVDSNDLLAAAACHDADSARRLLCDRCVTDARPDGAPIAAREFTDEDISAIGAALAEADPRAELSVGLRCTSCAHDWQVVLDVAAYFWKELDHLARRLLGEVHALAWAYGWREKDVLEMSDARRRFYLDAVGA